MINEDAIVGMRRKLAELRVQRARHQKAVDSYSRQIFDLEEEVEQAEAERPPRPNGPLPARRYGQVRTEIMRMIGGSIDGLSSRHIGRALRDRYGDLVAPRTHLTTLSRLREGGLAYKLDDRWRLTASGHGELLEMMSAILNI